MHRGLIGPVLIALPTGRDATLAAAVIADAGLPTIICRSLPELTGSISPEASALLLAQEALKDHGFDEFLDVLAKQSPWSDLPILYLNGLHAPASSRKFSARLFDKTSVTLLDRPLRRATLISAVQGALRARQRQWQVRGLLEDLQTSQKALQQATLEAEAANKSKDDFLATLSHELRTPLTPVLLTVTNLKSEPKLPRHVVEDLGMIERNIALEARLIDDLLDLTRVSRGKFPLRREFCDLHVLLNYAINIVRDDAKEKSISIIVEKTAAASGLEVDAARFQQVAWNLLKNAVKFTPEGGTITVRTANSSSWFVLTVSDSGIGFSPHNAESIFLPFEQAGRDPHTFGGLGLGLAISKAIIELHGGTIKASSHGVGSGAEFCVRLPNAENPPATVKNLGDGVESLSDAPTQLQILVVEDHVATLNVVKRLLKRAGYLVYSATSYNEAVNQLQSGVNFDILISDLGLPDGSGIDVMNTAQRLHPGLPGIVLTGYGMEDDLAKSKAAGFGTHLVKPIVFRQLQEAIETLAKFHR